MDIKTLRTKLEKIGQAQVLRFFDKLDSAGQDRLIKQLSALDLDHLKALVDENVIQRKSIPIPADIQPVKPFPRSPGREHAQLYRDAERIGHQMLKQGKIGAFLVAGGQGTRLGYDGPKGEYPVTPIKNKPLFRVFAEQLLAHGRDAGKMIPWYIMTSDINDAPTRAFFKKHNYFGYNQADIFFFPQGMMPAFATDGTMLLAETSSLALSPDGHGGSLRAIQKSGALADMKRRGVEHLSYFQVDNPIVQCIDPLFLGLHAIKQSEMSSKTIGKSGPKEKVGNFCIADGVLQVIEYSDLPDSFATQKNEDGSLKFNAGSIAIHAIATSFIERLNADGQLKLPWHRAEKKVPFINADGVLVKPEQPNAIKLEQFVFDAIPLAKNPIIYTTDRAEEFSPVKNATGSDSPETCMRDQTRRAARWLAAAGVEIPEKGDEIDAIIEISPLFAVDAEQLTLRKLPAAIKPGASVVLE